MNKSNPLFIEIRKLLIEYRSRKIMPDSDRLLEEWADEMAGRIVKLMEEKKGETNEL